MWWGSADHHVTCLTHPLPPSLPFSLSPMPSDVYFGSVILVYMIHKVCEKLRVFIRCSFILLSCHFFSPHSVQCRCDTVHERKVEALSFRSHRSLWKVWVDGLSEFVLVCVLFGGICLQRVRLGQFLTEPGKCQGWIYSLKWITCSQIRSLDQQWDDQ